MILRTGLFPKYATALIALMAVVLGVWGLLEMMLSYRESRESVAIVQRAEARLAAGRIEQFLAGIRSSVEEVGALPWGSPNFDESARVEEYRRLMKLAAPITEIRLVEGEGMQRARISRDRSDELSGQADLQALRAVEGARQGATYSPAYFKEGSEPHVLLTVLDKPPRTSATLVEINLRFVEEVIRRIQIGVAGRVFVVDGSDQLLAHENPVLVLRKTDLSSHEAVRELRRDLAAHGKDTAGMLAAEGLEGGAVMVSAALITGVNWMVVAEQPRGEVLQPVYDTLLRTAVLFSLGLLAASFLSYRLARRLSQPIVEVRRGAEKFARGDLSARIDVKTGDEVEALANEFNNMAAQLQDYTTGLERKVAEKTAELQLANRHKSEFLANMSHELRTPLNAVIGFSDALREEMFGKLNPKQAEYVRDIHASGQHLLSLINDILDLSKIEAGRMELDLAEFNVASALENCRTLIRERAHSRGLKLAFDLPADLGTWVADERKVKQVVLNLLSNAVKFTPPGGEVALAARREADALAIFVRDTGPGIASGDQATIFQEFRQLSTVGDAKNEGTGLGLSLSKRLVELHGGTIAVESAAGHGATFTVRFPALHPEAKSA